MRGYTVSQTRARSCGLFPGRTSAMSVCVDRIREESVFASLSVCLYVYLYLQLALYMYIWPGHTLSLGPLGPDPDPDPDANPDQWRSLLLPLLPFPSVWTLDCPECLSLRCGWLHSQLNRLSGHRGLGVL